LLWSPGDIQWDGGPGLRECSLDRRTLRPACRSRYPPDCVRAEVYSHDDGWLSCPASSLALCASAGIDARPAVFHVRGVHGETIGRERRFFDLSLRSQTYPRAGALPSTFTGRQRADASAFAPYPGCRGCRSGCWLLRDGRLVRLRKRALRTFSARWRATTLPGAAPGRCRNRHRRAGFLLSHADQAFHRTNSAAPGNAVAIAPHQAIVISEPPVMFQPQLLVSW